MLSQQERRLLGEMEAAMTEEDPVLAARLRRGRGGIRPWVEAHAAAVGAVFLCVGIAGVVMVPVVMFEVAVIGVFAMIAGALLIARPTERLTRRLARQLQAAAAP